MLGTSIGLNAVSENGACTAVFVAVAAICIFLTASIRTLNRMYGYSCAFCSARPTLSFIMREDLG